jgi:hypothetical protein
MTLSHLQTAKFNELEARVKNAERDYMNAQGELCAHINHLIKDRIKQFYQQADEPMDDKSTSDYNVKLPFAIEVGGNYYRVIQYHDSGDHFSIALYGNDEHRGRLVNFEIADWVYEQLNRMGFWDDNYTFELGPM